MDLSVFPPYGSSCLGRTSRLSGSFGNASLDGVTDFYSQLIYKVLLLLLLLLLNMVDTQPSHLCLSIRTTSVTPPHLPPHCPPRHHQQPGRS